MLLEKSSEVFPTIPSKRSLQHIRYHKTRKSCRHINLQEDEVRRATTACFVPVLEKAPLKYPKTAKLFGYQNFLNSEQQKKVIWFESLIEPENEMNMPPPGFEPESSPRKGEMIDRTTPQGRCPRRGYEPAEIRTRDHPISVTGVPSIAGTANVSVGHSTRLSYGLSLRSSPTFGYDPKVRALTGLLSMHRPVSSTDSATDAQYRLLPVSGSAGTRELEIPDCTGRDLNPGHNVGNVVY